MLTIATFPGKPMTYLDSFSVPIAYPLLVLLSPSVLQPVGFSILLALHNTKQKHIEQLLSLGCMQGSTLRTVCLPRTTKSG
jgi:hypothetical protein